MSAPYIIPFNFQPVNSGTINNASYTVPAGKYARVIATVQASARASRTMTAVPNSYIHSGYGGTDSKTVELWLRAGEVVTTTTTVASGTASNTINTPASVVSASTAMLSVGGVGTCLVNVPALDTTAATAVAGQSTSTLGGQATVIYRYEEFNIIS
jgi:hypothetical protein